MRAVAWRWHLGAIGLYLAAAYGIIAHGAGVTTQIWGAGSDVYAFIWFFAWWPYAVSHHAGLLYTALAWQPWGVHLGWTTCVPLLALIFAPVTLTLGPAAAYNLAMLAAPVVSGFASWLLCLRLTGNRWAALIGGFLFAFSGYEMAECLEELNLAYNFAPPLLVLLAVRRMNGEISRWMAIGGVIATLTAVFYLSVETFATTIVFGVGAWLLALVMLPDWRGRLLGLLGEGSVAMVGVVLCCAPFLMPMLMYRDVQIPLSWAYFHVAHLGGLVVPSPRIMLTDPRLGREWQYGFCGWLPENDAVTGLPLIAMLGLLARERGGQAAMRFAFMLLLVILLCSLGPNLWWNWRQTPIILPWRLVVGLPLLGSALPVRFLAYSSLLVAVLCALWLAGGRRRMALGAFACLMLMPAPHPVKPVPLAALFQPGRLQAVVAMPHPRVLILPGWDQDASPLWQAQNQFGFAATRGFLGMPPAKEMKFPGLVDISFGLRPAGVGGQIRQYCFATGTQFVLAPPDVQPDLLALFEGFGWPMKQVDGFAIFTVPPAAQ
ncbi:hypothetical protein [Acidocella sp.]|uniref:hypothetical protein n=1 Tax=Acidocella sp. TaxID=50710 RepID=UPI0026399DFD|nr:hypothetical protein [Acidocella sp.]